MKLKTQIVIKLKNSNCDQTQELKLWKIKKLKLLYNSKTEMVTELKNSNSYKTNKKNSNYNKTKLVTKLKWWQNSKCDKTQVVTKPKLWQNSNCEKKNLKSDKTQIVTVVSKKTFL